MAVETEVKIRVESAEQARGLLARCGFKPIGPREFESNVLYDTAGQQLRSAGQLIRIRKVGGRGILTYKGKAANERYKSREELETSVEDADKLAEILERLGFEPAFHYEKYRTEFGGGGPGLILLDETPIGDFLELEGDGAWIDETATLLGFSTTSYMTSSYGTLFASYCREHGLVPGSMTFKPCNT